MTNPFTTNELLKSLSNYPVVKGDLPGHEFHGNQWTHIGDGIKDLTNKLNGHTPNGRRGTPAQMAKAHKAIAEMHRQKAGQLRGRVEGMTSPENLHRDGEATRSQVRATLARAREISEAADLHEKAAIAHERAASIQRDPSLHEAVASGRVLPSLGRQLATADAIDASKATPEGRTSTISPAETSRFNDLYDRGLI